MKKFLCCLLFSCSSYAAQVSVYPVCGEAQPSRVVIHNQSEGDINLRLALSVPVDISVEGWQDKVQNEGCYFLDMHSDEGVYQDGNSILCKLVRPTITHNVPDTFKLYYMMSGEIKCTPGAEFSYEMSHQHAFGFIHGIAHIVKTRSTSDLVERNYGWTSEVRDGDVHLTLMSDKFQTQAIPSTPYVVQSDLVSAYRLYKQYYMSDRSSTHWFDFIDDWKSQRNGLTDVKRSEEVVVSLTSYPARIQTTWLAIESLLRQTEKPDRIVLNLFEGEFPGRVLPFPIRKQMERGLEINWNSEPISNARLSLFESIFPLYEKLNFNNSANDKNIDLMTTWLISVLNKADNRSFIESHSDKFTILDRKNDFIIIQADIPFSIAKYAIEPLNFCNSSSVTFTSEGHTMSFGVYGALLSNVKVLNSERDFQVTGLNQSLTINTSYTNSVASAVQNLYSADFHQLVIKESVIETLRRMSFDNFFSYLPDVSIACIYPVNSLGEGNVARYFEKTLSPMGIKTKFSNVGLSSTAKNQIELVMHLLVDIHNHPLSDYSYMMLHTGSIAFSEGNRGKLSKFKFFMQVGKQSELCENSQFGNINPFYFSCPVTEKVIQEYSNPTIFYCGGTWDNRYSEMMDSLDGLPYFNWYGGKSLETKKSYKGFCDSVQEAIFSHKISLLLHSNLHKDNEEPSCRIFEAASVGAIIISDLHPFIIREFGDNVLYFDSNKSPHQTFEEIKNIYNWILSNPDEAIRKAKAAHEIFLKKFSLNLQVPKLIYAHQLSLLLSNSAALRAKKSFEHRFSSDQFVSVSNVLKTLLIDNVTFHNYSSSLLRFKKHCVNIVGNHYNVSEDYTYLKRGVHQKMEAGHLLDISDFGDVDVILSGEENSLDIVFTDDKRNYEFLKLLNSISLSTLNHGQEVMQDKTITFCSIVRNNAKDLPLIMANIEFLGSNFSDYRVIFYENDSNDGSKEILQDWSERNSKVKLISENLGVVKRPSIKFLSDARNKYLREYFKGERTDVVCVLDVDFPYGFDLRGIQSSFHEFDKWGAVCANGIDKAEGNMYDAFAFRNSEFPFSHMDRPTDYWGEYIRSIQKAYTVDGNLVEVYSGFGGLCLYKSEFIENCQYDSINEDCEHVYFHNQARERSAMKMFLNPKMVLRYSHYK